TPGGGVKGSDVPPLERDSARRGAKGAGDHAEQSSLAGPIGPDEAADQLFGNVKANVPQCRHAPKVLGQRLYFQDLHVFSATAGPPGEAIRPGRQARTG